MFGFEYFTLNAWAGYLKGIVTQSSINHWYGLSLLINALYIFVLLLLTFIIYIHFALGLLALCYLTAAISLVRVE